MRFCCDDIQERKILFGQHPGRFWGGTGRMPGSALAPGTYPLSRLDFRGDAQQTRVEAVKPYYQRFLEALPDLPALAAAEEQTLLKLWEGLGYYSRARNLQKAARQAMERYGGVLPASYEELLSLAGFGEYTAGAVASIAFGIRVPAVDGNVLRVFSRLLAAEGDIMSPGCPEGIPAAAAESNARNRSRRL